MVVKECAHVIYTGGLICAEAAEVVCVIALVFYIFQKGWIDDGAGWFEWWVQVIHAIQMDP